MMPRITGKAHLSKRSPTTQAHRSNVIGGVKLIRETSTTRSNVRDDPSGAGLEQWISSSELPSLCGISHLKPFEYPNPACY